MAKGYRPTIEYLRQCVRQENGKLFWLTRPREHFKTNNIHAVWNASYAGKEACSWIFCKSSGWRCKITIKPFVLFRSHIVWALHKNEWPVRLDHENRNTEDDRIENLREATASQNAANSKKKCNNTSGYKGVKKVVTRWKTKWTATIGETRKHLGTFGTPEEAHAAYLEAATQKYGEFACGG